MDRDCVLDISPTEIGEAKTKVLQIYQLLRIFSNYCLQKNVKQIEKLKSSFAPLQNVNTIQAFNPDALQTPESWEMFRSRVIHEILFDAYNEYQDDNNELIFLAAAMFKLERLEEIIRQFRRVPSTYKEDINQTRYSDSVLVFVLKYGDIDSDSFLECMTILTEADVDVNTFDIKGKTAIDHVAALHENHKDNENLSNTLKSVARLFLDKGLFKPDYQKTLEFLAKDVNVDTEKHEFSNMDVKTRLFYYLINNKKEKLLEFRKIKDYVNSDNGENTLLQMACKKSDNMLPVVEFLLKNNADPNKTTRNNSLCPLELAGINNNQKIFEAILKHKSTNIELKHYNNFVRWRSQSLKPKLFELILESNKIDPHFVYDKTGNTPLHYAILFCHKKAIQNLLKRHSSLIIKNRFDKAALDIIDPEDLEKYFDSCLALDNYTPYFSDVNYKMKFRFNCLIDDRTSREVKVISKIGNRQNVEHLLIHPFIHTFITLKWHKVRGYFWFMLLLQASIFLLLSVLFYRLPQAHLVEYSFCGFFTFINVVLKAPIVLCFTIKDRWPQLFALNRALLHGCLEIFLMVTMIGSFFQDQFRAFTFVEMAVCFLLTAGYHPGLSKWSLMLQQVFKTFSILLIFFSLIVIAFSIGFHVLFPEHGLFGNLFIAIFKTYIMTTGEFNIDEEMSFQTGGFGGYLLFLLFAMSISLVIVNFWTGVAVTDIERIEKNSEVNASKNVIIFMLFIDYMYATQSFAKLRKFVPNPLLFLNIDEKGDIFHKPEKCEVNFFVNKERQFEEKGQLPSKVDSECFNKIRCHYYKLREVPKEKEILQKLDELSKMLKEIKCKCNCSQEEVNKSEAKPRKYTKKGK